VPSNTSSQAARASAAAAAFGSMPTKRTSGAKRRISRAFAPAPAPTSSTLGAGCSASSGSNSFKSARLGRST
jgi:hypothetical protein